MEYKKKIEDRVLINQKTGSPFAFMIDTGVNEQIWIIITFLFYDFDSPKPKCNYWVHKQSVKKGEIKLLNELTFESFKSLIDYLVEQEVDSEYCRAVH